MPAERKVTDADLARMRRLHDEGARVVDLAEEFGVSVRHARRLVHGQRRPTIAGLDPEMLAGGVAAAVTAFLDGRDLDRGDAVLAVTAAGLARKLDDCLASDSAAGAQAVPRIAAQLVDVLDRLRGVVVEPDGIDRLRRRRAARRLAAFAGNGGAP